jgi:DNA-binding response OmpR family regulator
MTQNTPLNKPVFRIIIVEDDKPLLNTLVKYLTLEGYEVTGGSSAYEFYQHIFAEPYAVAILDVPLPDQSALVLAEYVRNNTNMRIIRHTVPASIDDELAGHQAGADIYLVKPVDFRKLSVSIAALLARLEVPTVEPQYVAKKPQSPLSGKWRLITLQSILQTPSGSLVKLTPKELDFMTQLVVTPKIVVSRYELRNKLGYLNNESGNHSLQSLINRLRQKIESCDLAHPNQTSHAIGYIFFADIIVE